MKKLKSLVALLVILFINSCDSIDTKIDRKWKEIRDFVVLNNLNHEVVELEKDSLILILDSYEIPLSQIEFEKLQGLPPGQSDSIHFVMHSCHESGNCIVDNDPEWPDSNVSVEYISGISLNFSMEEHCLKYMKMMNELRILIDEKRINE